MRRSEKKGCFAPFAKPRILADDQPKQTNKTARLALISTKPRHWISGLFYCQNAIKPAFDWMKAIAL